MNAHPWFELVHNGEVVRSFGVPGAGAPYTHRGWVTELMRLWKPGWEWEDEEEEEEEGNARGDEL